MQALETALLAHLATQKLSCCNLARNTTEKARGSAFPEMFRLHISVPTSMPEFCVCSMTVGSLTL